MNSLKVLYLVKLSLLSDNFSSKLDNSFKLAMISHGVSPISVDYQLVSIKFLKVMMEKLINKRSKPQYLSNIILYSIVNKSVNKREDLKKKIRRVFLEHP